MRLRCAQRLREHSKGSLGATRKVCRLFERSRQQWFKKNGIWHKTAQGTECRKGVRGGANQISPKQQRRGCRNSSVSLKKCLRRTCQPHLPHHQYHHSQGTDDGPDSQPVDSHYGYVYDRGGPAQKEMDGLDLLFPSGYQSLAQSQTLLLRRGSATSPH